MPKETPMVAGKIVRKWLAGATLIAMYILCSMCSAKALEELVRPSAADATIQQFDMENVVIEDDATRSEAPLVVFLPGTGGKPQNVLKLLRFISSQGYRVIGLSYDDTPAVNQRCPQDPDPTCSAAFRAMRSFGPLPEASHVAPVSERPVYNPPGESIVARLAALLRYLDLEHPGAGWDRYLSNSQPAWTHIVLSGFSQGAGMAAFIAKQDAVFRVVLFSSPWDITGADSHPAPWLRQPSSTPAERWWAERAAHETMTTLIANAYSAMAIPSSHIVIFDHPLPKGAAATETHLHAETVKDTAFAQQWGLLYGSWQPRSSK